MNARALQNLFAEWRQLSEAEHEAIAADDWAKVKQHQDKKRGLKGRILVATEAWQKLWPKTGETYSDYEQQFRPQVAELIALEMSNSQLLAEHRESTERQLTEWNRASGNLRGLNRAYGVAAGAQWTSYS